MGMKKKIAIIGNFGDLSKQVYDGQTIKTRVVTNELINYFGKEEVITFNTFGGILNLLKAPIICIKALCKASNIIIFPAHNGVRVFVPLLSILSFFVTNCRLHYCVIGGWLPKFLRNRLILRKSLRMFYAIYVETNTMRINLEALGFNNIVLLPNFKDLKIINKNDITTAYSKPYKLCTFSRVCKEKGIEDAIKAITEINEQNGGTIYSLDIYGKIDSSQVEWFDRLKSKFPEYVSYRGVVDFNGSVEVLKDYYALLFPTHYYTEGIPGTIIDAYAAGLPVISAKWQSFADIIDDNITGIGYEFDDYNEFKLILENIYKDSSKIIDLKFNCINKAKAYSPEQALSALINNIK